MKKIFFVASLLLGNLFSVNGQAYCTTPCNSSNFLSTLSSFNSVANSYQIRVVAHIVRRTNGTGGMTMSELNTAMSILNQDYNPHNICFTLVNQDYINNDSYYDGAINISIFSVNSTANAIDMYFLPNTCPTPGGRAQNIVAKAFVSGGTWTTNPPNAVVNTSHIISHEMGHCLGLFHTHHGTYNEGTLGECAELVNGSNSSTCGDFVTDTPADPHLGFNVSTSCNWLGSGTDANGYPYNPNTNIIMAYTNPTCMQLFTVGQKQRMLSHIANSTLLQAVSIPNGCTAPCPANLTFTTAVSNGDYEASATIVASNTVSAGQDVEYDAGSSITLQPNFWAQNGSIFHAVIEGCGGIYMPPPPDGDNTQFPELSPDNYQAEKMPIALELTIYPNPTTGIISISCPTDVQSIRLYDVSGRELRVQNIVNNNLLQIDLSNYSAGIYFIKTNTGVTQKIVKI